MIFRVPEFEIASRANGAGKGVAGRQKETDREAEIDKDRDRQG